MMEDMETVLNDDEEENKGSQTSQSKLKDSINNSLDYDLVEIVPNETGAPGYKCKVCQVFYPRKSHMILHVRIHTGEKPYVCDYENCGKAFSRPGTLSDHKKRNHEKVFQHVCPICEKRFYGRSDMLTHIVIHDEARQQRERFLPSQMMSLLSQVEEFNFDGQLIMSNCVCRECGKIFDKKGGKERHVKNVHSKHLKIADPENFPTLIKPKQEEIKVEVDPIIGIKAEPCDIFEQGEDVKDEYIKEENKFHEEKGKDSLMVNHFDVTDLNKNESESQDTRTLFSCNICDNTLSSKESLEIHKLIHAELNRFLCKEKDCSKMFANNKSLKKHLKEAHNIEKTNDNRMFHMCPECGKQCSTKAGLQDHMLCHSNEKKFVCIECGKKLKRRDTLQQHMRIHTGELKYQCDQCESRYASSAALRNHTLSKHTVVKNAPQFMCNYCGKNFPKKAYLLKHITGHTGEKNYHCTVCEKKFRFETSLQNHMNMHNGIKNFQCPYCGKRFTQRQQMNIHIRRHTGDKRHKCEICSEAFIEPRCLRNHMKRHHDMEQPSPNVQLACVPNLTEIPYPGTHFLMQ